MDVTRIPFNNFMGIQRAEQTDIGLLKLESLHRHENHLGTVHAAAQFAVAEACSGEYLITRFGEHAGGCIPVVRRAEVKYHKPATGDIFARAQVSEKEGLEFIEELSRRGRAKIGVAVQVVDAENNTTMSAVFEWYVQRGEAGAVRG